MLEECARPSDGDFKRLLIGQSARTRQILRLIEKLGRSRWPVLLLGETGTGKEVVARSIHNVSGKGPFVTIDCSALVGPLMESELFGHVKGAFTNAISNKTGLIEAANGGTAFFDEIGELPLDLQAKLLRVLQEKEFRPVGSLIQRKSDFRIVAATNRDLAAEVGRGAFRRDLYYRLSVVNLRMAPLRERKEDVPALVAHFLSRYANGHTLSHDALEAMLAYDWPGNVRELENCVQHIAAVTSGPIVHTADLPSSVQNQFRQQQAARAVAAAGAVGAAAGAGWGVSAVAGGQAVFPSRGTGSSTIRGSWAATSIPAAATPGILPLVEVEKRAILDALAFTKGDRVMAANLLGIGRTTLYRKLREYGAGA